MIAVYHGPPGTSSGSPESSSPGVNALGSRATAAHLGKIGEQRLGGGERIVEAGEDG